MIPKILKFPKKFAEKHPESNTTKIGFIVDVFFIYFFQKPLMRFNTVCVPKNPLMRFNIVCVPKNPLMGHGGFGKSSLKIFLSKEFIKENCVT